MEVMSRCWLKELYKKAKEPVPKIILDAPKDRVFCFGYDPVMRLTLPLHPWGYQLHGLYLQDRGYKRPTHGYPVFISPLPIVDEDPVNVTDIISGVEVSTPVQNDRTNKKSIIKGTMKCDAHPTLQRVLFCATRTQNVAKRWADMARQGDAWTGTSGTGRHGRAMSGEDGRAME